MAQKDSRVKVKISNWHFFKGWEICSGRCSGHTMRVHVLDSGSRILGLSLSHCVFEQDAWTLLALLNYRLNNNCC